MERFAGRTIKKDKRNIAYFSMEIGLDSKIPTYSGGLGILAGDTIRSCADLHIPVVATTLLYRKGYFTQKLDSHGNQTESDVKWKPELFLKKTDKKVIVEIEDRKVAVTAWQYNVTGVAGYKIPVIFLDTNLKENNPYDRNITNWLYGGDWKYRLCQEIILGIGGVRILEALGYNKIKKYHMNEGHSSLLIFELLRRQKGRKKKLTRKDYDAVRSKCLFTTHTPVPSGHDHFPLDVVKNSLKNIISPEEIDAMSYQGNLDLTHLAMDNSQYINGVAKKHGEISRKMFPGHLIDSITNGIHSVVWTSKYFREIYDKYIPGWQKDSFSLRYALGIPDYEIWNAHKKAKKDLIDYVNKEHPSADLKSHIFTIGFARRSATYKRGTLLFSDINRLLEIAQKKGEIQIIYAGKAHPNDSQGKEIIKFIFSKMKELKGKISVVYLENYGIEIAKKIVSGVDLWLNTPQKPLEASGTSGMKACHNGIPNLSILDGWWIEGHIENKTGWSIGTKAENSNEEDARDLYYKLDEKIVPKYYNNREQWINIMKHSIAYNASFFNTHRMMHQYVLNAYFR
ncbi:MAG: alpha-glucan family phosphorylase [Candidatus Nanohalarchaeota archaeon]|nr:MAG: alpha-glucan family phosphorylase [Candidatus Nanohaloarchaeota archaeon]